jgi:hypothetical protein
MPSDAPSGRSRASAPGTASDPDPRLRPGAAALLGLEALMLLAGAGYCLLGVLRGGLDTSFGLGIGGFLLLFAVLAGLAARSVLRRGRFGLGYGITWQMFQALVGASMLRAALYLPGALALLLAIGAFFALVALVRSTPIPGGED